LRRNSHKKWKKIVYMYDWVTVVEYYVYDASNYLNETEDAR